MLLHTWPLLLLCAIAECRRISSCEDKGCSHTCDLEEDTATCSCPGDMTLAADDKTCQASVSILLGMFRGVVRVTEAGKLATVLPIRAKTFDYDFAKKQLFTFANNTILRYSLSDSSAPPETVTSVDTMVTSLAVDWVHDDVFWICHQQSAVETALAQGGGHRVLITHDDTDDLPRWHNIVVDPYAKKLFWLGKHGVYTSDLAGRDVQSSLGGWEFQVEDIALDTHTQQVYVIGSQGSESKVVGRSRYDGTQGREVFTVDQPDSKIFGFGVIGSTVYWESNYDGETLYKCETPKLGRKPNITVVQELNQIVYDMKIYHPDVQKPQK